MFYLDHAAVPVLSLRQQVPVHMVDDVPHGLLPHLQVGSLLAHVRCIHDGRQIHAGSLAEEPPDHARHEGHEGEEGEYEWRPLVVADHLLAVLDHKVVSRYGLVHRQVVRVADPADRVGVVTVAVGELGRAPAAHRHPDELFRADEEAETDEYDHCNTMTQSVHVVVIHVKFELSDEKDRFE